METTGTADRWESTLDSVVVYAQGALCRRLAEGRVPRDGRIRVTGLPRSLDPGSLRARALGPAGVRVTGARVEVGAEPVDGGPPDGLLREAGRLRDAHAAALARRDRQSALVAEFAGLRPVPPTPRRGDPHRPAPVDAWLELSAFVDARLARLHARLAELEDALRDAGHALAVAEDRLARASTDAAPAHVATTVSAVLTLDGADAGAETGIELEYGVPGAVWAPAYRLTHRQGDGGGRLVLRASVAQRTGEDWTGVRVALATADLGRRADLPRLRSMRIGRRQPAPAPSGWREPPPGLASLFTGYDAAGPRPVSPSGAVAVAGGPVAPPPPPPPPPAPMGYGAAPAALPQPGGAYPAAPAFTGAPPPQPATARRARAAAPARPGGMPAAAAPAAPGGPVPSPPVPAAGPPAGPPRPSDAELDYAALVLSPPDGPAARRGLLFPGPSGDAVAGEHRRRAEAVASLPLPVHAVRPRVSAGSFDHRYDAAARADVPSDGTWHTVTVGEIPVGLRTEYLCVPSVEQTVYATLVLSNATGQALLAGPVEVTVDDEFLLTAALPTLPPGGVRRVGLGQAEGIGVTRRTSTTESTAGLRNSTTVLDQRVRVELVNRLAAPVTVEVRERVPVTTDADVRIQERADWAPPGPDTQAEDPAPGTRVWRARLDAGGGAVFEGGYEIRFPANKSLDGGNRRS
ncbi:DUF4139 domain-containing protein [Streptomyces genisteinicus]|uniref:DUF4139 domain-containing protein n=1 Tax=Streptomyces genisteinicus TaxID=2768068 RepID=A0A7H0HM65_9ACTN|nr:DUF4139 domain-containing protein [Streptomyces genisteinicus]QNP61631.1 DUF4139 domain-containing protein [Streptomyces genisteinicus]